MWSNICIKFYLGVGKDPSSKVDVYYSAPYSKTEAFLSLTPSPLLKGKNAILMGCLHW